MGYHINSYESDKAFILNLPEEVRKIMPYTIIEALSLYDQDDFYYDFMDYVSDFRVEWTRSLTEKQWSVVNAFFHVTVDKNRLQRILKETGAYEHHEHIVKLWDMVEREQHLLRSKLLRESVLGALVPEIPSCLTNGEIGI